MKSALKKSVVSTSISLILASGMAAFAAHAADDVKLKATKTNVAFSDFTPTEYSTKGKPNIIILTMDDLGYGQLHDFPLFLGQKIPYQKEVVHNQDHPWLVR